MKDLPARRRGVGRAPQRKILCNRVFAPFAVLACVFLSSLGVSICAAEGPNVKSMSNAEATARKGLQAKHYYNWYDREKDDVRSLKIQPRYDWSWLDDWFNSKSTNTASSSSWGAFVSFMSEFVRIMFWVLIAVIIAAAVYIVVRGAEGFSGLRRQLRKRGKPLPSAEPNIEALPIDLRSGPIDFLEQVKLYLQRGEFHLAIIYLFSHELLELDKRHLLRLVKGKTNGQYVRELGDRPALARGLRIIAAAFEEAYFGGRRLSERQFDACWNAHQEITQALEMPMP